MNRRNRLNLIGMALLITAAGPTAGANTYDVWVNDYTAQGLLGATRFENFKFNVDDSETPQEVDLATMPQFGGAWSTLPVGDHLQFGLETSFLIGLKVDKINYLYAGGSGLRVSLSSSLWMFDFAGGGYANLYLGKSRKARIYAGGGPLMMYASYRTDKDFDDASVEDEIETESAFGLGLYARAGIEFRIYQAGMLGLGVRGTWSNLDFSNAGGRSDLTGVAAFATFTAGF
jgi:hypothetical protein